MSSITGSSELERLLSDLEEEAVLELVRRRVAAGDDGLAIIEDCNAGMRLVGERYEQGEYFLSGLIMAGEIFREVVEIVEPALPSSPGQGTPGRVLLGTVQGDIHDIGKDMTGMLLTCHGFTVLDLGVDVPPTKFAEEVAQQKPDIVGLSGVLTASYEVMRKTVAVLREQSQATGYRYPIIIGGGTIDDQICSYIGADYWSPNAMSAVHLCQGLMAGERGHTG